MDNIYFLRNITSLQETNNVPSEVISISLTCSNLESLAGIEKFTKLDTLNIDKCEIRNIDHLSRLSNLRRLHISYCSIKSITALSGLTNLTDLDLYLNNIENLEPLSGLTKLVDLNLYTDNIVNIEPLFKLRSLRNLWIGNNPISMELYNGTRDVLTIPSFVLYQYRLNVISRKFRIIVLRNKIKLYWMKFLERKNKDGISILCVLSINI